MNSQQRFYETLHFGNPDRVPYFEEGIRPEVIETWQAQGLASAEALMDQYPTDLRTEIRLDIDPHPRFEEWPTNLDQLAAFQSRYDPSDASRMPDNWVPQKLVNRDGVVMVRVHEGLFLSMGVSASKSFTRLMFQLTDQPDFIKEYMRLLGIFSAALTENILREVPVDALIFSEPIGDNNGALISPRMYEEIVLPSYTPLLDLAARYQVKTIICRTYASMKALIPCLLDWGINVLWACEVEQGVMNYPALRREFGTDLKLIGGIDLDALRGGKTTIREAVNEIAPLIEAGGYIPLADGRVRADIPYENYQYYRECLLSVTT